MLSTISLWCAVLPLQHTVTRYLCCTPGAALPTPRDPQQGAAPAAEVAARFAAMPASLRGALMPFQRQGVAYGLARRGRVLIADEMGVGKTVQALALAACYQVRGCGCGDVACCCFKRLVWQGLQPGGWMHPGVDIVNSQQLFCFSQRQREVELAFLLREKGRFKVLLLVCLPGCVVQRIPSCRTSGRCW